MSPMGPSSSTRVPKGWRELIGYNDEDKYMQVRPTVKHAYVALDASDEELVRIVLRVLNKVRRSLLSGDGNERHTLVGRLEPDDLGALDRAARLVALVTLALAALSLLLLLSSRRRRTEQAEGAGEELAGHALDNSNDVTSELRLDLVGDSITCLAYDQTSR